jgi:hypothetical protein
MMKARRERVNKIKKKKYKERKKMRGRDMLKGKERENRENRKEKVTFKIEKEDMKKKRMTEIKRKRERLGK